MKNENKCDFCIAHLAKICDVDETKEQCLIFQEILNQKLQLALTEQQTKIQNMQIMPGTCKPVPMLKCPEEKCSKFDGVNECVGCIREENAGDYFEEL